MTLPPITYTLKLISWRKQPGAAVQVGIYAAGVDPLANAHASPVFGPLWVDVDLSQTDEQIITAIHAAVDNMLDGLDSDTVAVQRAAGYLNQTFAHVHTPKV